MISSVPTKKFPQSRKLLIEESQTQKEPRTAPWKRMTFQTNGWAKIKQEENSSEHLFPNFQEVLLLKRKSIKSTRGSPFKSDFSSICQRKSEGFLEKPLITSFYLDRGFLRGKKKELFTFKRHNQPDMLLVLDEFDELPTSILPAFKGVIQGKMLSKCHIVVTASHEVGMKM